MRNVQYNAINANERARMYRIVYVFALCSEIKGLPLAAKCLENIPKTRKSGHTKPQICDCATRLYKSENIPNELKEKEKKNIYLSID
jgi:hypothetical protein